MKRRLKSILPLLLIILSAAAAELLLANFAFVLYGGNAEVRNFVPDVDNYYLVERTDTQFSLGSLGFEANGVSFQTRAKDDPSRSFFTTVGVYVRSGDGEFVEAVSKRIAVGGTETLHFKMQNADVIVLTFGNSKGEFYLSNTVVNPTYSLRFNAVRFIVIALAAALIFAFSMSAAWLFSEWFTKPLRQLSGAARQVAQGDYAVQVETNRRDELGDLAQEFNHMAKEVQHAAQMQRDLLANVSHDLRTPLTLIKGYAETVRDITGDDKAHRDEQMNIIVDEADRLTALVSSVMELSKVTSGAEKCEKVHFDMGQLCDEVSERYDAVCAQNGWQLKLELPEEELPVYADPNMMQRTLHNLLGNAMHHIGGDGIFLLRASKVPEGVRVEIEDHGPGICAEDLPYIFDRYYRSRSDAGKQGTGLGLSITKAIFQQHGFRFGVQSTLGKGTTFWFIATDTK